LKVKFQRFMTDPTPNEELRPESDKSKPVESGAPSPVANVQKDLAGARTEVEPAQSKKLTPEEQMALYEKDLKENDWGHQPC
jgi:hypothetical protein